MMAMENKYLVKQYIEKKTAEMREEIIALMEKEFGVQG